MSRMLRKLLRDGPTKIDILNDVVPTGCMRTSYGRNRATKAFVVAAQYGAWAKALQGQQCSTQHLFKSTRGKVLLLVLQARSGA